MVEIRLGTRKSELARTQSGLIAAALEQLGARVTLTPIHTQGDVTAQSLSKLGGVGVFAAALRLALLSGECDIAVHSFKDVPTAPVPGLVIAAVPPRADRADVLVTARGLALADLPAGARVGTGSPRRAAALLAARPDLQIVDIRGNVGTRLSRVRGVGQPGDLDAVVLARAGLVRLDSKWASSPVLESIPAPAQGALAVEARADSPLLDLLGKLDDPRARMEAVAERAVLEGLQAGCAAPVGARAHASSTTLTLEAQVLSTDGSQRVSRVLSTSLPDAGLPDTDLSDADLPHTGEPDNDEPAHQLGLNMASQLLAAGAGEITDLSATKTRASHSAPTRLTPSAPARASHSAPARTNRAQDCAATGTPTARVYEPPTSRSAEPSDFDEPEQQRWGGRTAPDVDRSDAPLTGRSVFIPRSGADNLSASLRAAGAHVHAHPLTRTELDTNPLPYLMAGVFDWVVFTSKRTVKAFAAFASADSPAAAQYADQPDYAPLREVWRQARASSLHGFRVAALGQSTASELREVGIEIDFEVVEKVTAEEFCHQFTSAPPGFTRHPHLWGPASAKARHVIKDELTRKGWGVDQTPVYDTVAVTSVPTEVSTGWTMGMFDAVVFTAASNAQAAANLLGPLPDSSRVVTFGPPSARAAQAAGFSVDAVAQTQTAAGLVAAVEQAFQKH